MFGRKTLEEKISTIIREEFAEIIADLEGDHREFRRRLELKEETKSAFEDAQDEARKLRSGRISLKKRFWEAYYEKDEADLSEVEFQSRRFERAAKQTEKLLEKARADFEKADFDEVVEGFALKTKANITEDEVNRRIDAIEETLEDLLAGVRHEVKEASRALSDEYKEPRFDTVEEQNAHVKRTIEILNAVAATYKPPFRWGHARGTRNADERPGNETLETTAAPQEPIPRSWWRRMFGK